MHSVPGVETLIRPAQTHCAVLELRQQNYLLHLTPLLQTTSMSTISLCPRNPRVNLEVLTGIENYKRWVQNFKLFAKAEGVWEFYEGTADILTKPDRDNYGIPGVKKERDTADAGLDSSHASASTTEAIQSANLLELNVLEFKHDMEE